MKIKNLKKIVECTFRTKMFKDSRSKTKIPEIPAIGCDYLYCRGKNAGNSCDKEPEKDTKRCQGHTKKEEAPTGCIYKIKEYDNIPIYCNKEKEKKY